MTEIIDGKLVSNELTKNAHGGTELMAQRMVRDIPQDLLDGVQIIHSRVRELHDDKIKVLVLHDLPQDPEVQNLTDPEYRKQFDAIVFVSDWQQQMYNLTMGIPFGAGTVIHNAIAPIEVNHAEDKKLGPEDPIRLIYHTTPHRGLALLIPTIKEASKHFNIHLDVFSSFNIYGWGERDEEYKWLFDEMNKSENITNHGFQPNQVVRDYLKKSHIFAYPNIWTETSCLSLIEAMSAGNLCIHSNLGALPETSLGLTSSYGFVENNQLHVNRFHDTLMSVLGWVDSKRNDDALTQTSAYISVAANNRYNWEAVALPKWVRLLEKLKNERVV